MKNSTEAVQRSNGKQIYLIVWMAESQIHQQCSYMQPLQHCDITICTIGANRPEMKDKVLKTNMQLYYMAIIHMLWLWLPLEWYTGQLTLNTAFKLDVILACTQMSFSHIRDDMCDWI